jgi:hypothetical protein
VRKGVTLFSILLFCLPVVAGAVVADGWERHAISAQYRPMYLYVKDIDRDGDLDIVSATNQHPGLFYSEVAWFRNNLNQNTPWEKFIIDSATAIAPINNANGVVVADMDGDGYQDVAVATGRVTTYAGGIYWYKAPADPTGQWQRFVIEEGTIDSYFKIYAMDANNDGLMDLVVGGRKGGTVIFLNPGNPALPNVVWQKINLPEGTGSSIYLNDLNNDGRLDIVNTLLHGNVSWIDPLYQNEQFVFNRAMIDPNLDNAFDVNCLDVNGDSKQDVLVTVFTVPNIFWYENPPNTGDPWIQHLVTNTYKGTDLYTGDINIDGKADFVVSGVFDKKISWFQYRWENGQAVWTEHLIDDSINEPGDISLNDVDGDGDLDVVVCGQKEDQMIWYENKLAPPVVQLAARCLMKQAYKPKIQEQKSIWMILFCSEGHRFNKQASIIKLEGAEEGFQGVTINKKRSPLSIGKLIFVPLSIEKWASVGQWKIMITTVLPSAGEAESLKADFEIR